MNISELNQSAHRRLNLLTGEWILVSPHRMDRPWQGQVEEVKLDEIPRYDPNCYLCPGNTRANGCKNPDYQDTFVFDNDFSALLPDNPIGRWNQSDLLRTWSEAGICRVVCFSPRHDLTLPEMTFQEIINVIEVWIEQYNDLGSRSNINHVQIFENKGLIMGCSNPHPHGQIWAQHSIPQETTKELYQLNGYYRKKRRCLICDYLKLEKQLSERIVVENNGFFAVVPFWAIWPFEVLIISKRHFGSFADFDEKEKKSYANILKQITVKYDNLFQTSFPYSAGIHQTPTDNREHPECHFHMHFYPPLLRSATIKKFMVGYEMLGEPQRDMTPEKSAETLRKMANVHWKISSSSLGV